MGKLQLNIRDYASCAFAGLFIAVIAWLCITAGIGILWLHDAIEPVDPMGWPLGASLVIGFAAVVAAVFFERKSVRR